MKLYTKKGDKGQTSLRGNTMILKNHVRLEAYGTIDELNSFIGLLMTFSLDESNLNYLKRLQNNLFTIGSNLATDTSKISLTKASILESEEITFIEQEIDRLTEAVLPIKEFILPGGTTVAAISHICRTVARRAERRLYDLNQEEMVDKRILIYINRLSDYFFALSRFINHRNGIKDIFCEKKE